MKIEARRHTTNGNTQAWDVWDCSRVGVPSLSETRLMKGKKAVLAGLTKIPANPDGPGQCLDRPPRRARGTVCAGRQNARR